MRADKSGVTHSASNIAQFDGSPLEVNLCFKAKFFAPKTSDYKSLSESQIITELQMNTLIKYIMIDEAGNIS